MGSDPGAGGSSTGQGRRRRQRTEEQAPQQEAPQQAPQQGVPELVDEEMVEQPGASVQDIVRRYKERVRVASRQLGELQIAVAVREAQLAEQQRETDRWRERAETAERRLELAQDEIRF